MGIRDSLTSWFGGGRVAPAETSTHAIPVVQPLAAPANGVSSSQMGFMDGADGQRALVWQKTYNGFRFGAGYGPYFGTPGSEISRERPVVASVSMDMLTTNSVIATLAENLATKAIGNGLTLSSKPNYATLEMTAEDARALSHQIEQAWQAWAKNPQESDASGRHTLHQLATAAYKSWLVTGESIVLLDWQRGNGSRTATKVKLLDTRQLDQSITRVQDGGNILQGVQFDQAGRLVGYWIRPVVLGNINRAPQPVFVRANTSWGRARALHLFDLMLPGQIRGLSPLVAALTPARSKAMLGEYTMTDALVQTMMAATVHSDLPNALKGLDSGDGLQPIDISGAKDPQAWLATRNAWYAEKGISLNPGVVNHLAPNDKLMLHRSETPNATYQAFDSSIAREAAKAAGSSAEDLSGDYSKTSFSASRLAEDLPARINERRRKAIPERFYSAVFKAWLEEACETGVVKLPKGAPAFWEQPDAYSESVWRGKGKAVADPLKQAQADILEIENGLSTLEEKLGERGMDFEDIIAQRRAEREQLEAAGLNYPVPKNRDDWQPEDDASLPPK